MITEATTPAADDSAEIASVFGLDLSFLASTEPGEPLVPAAPAAAEPAAGVVAPSPAAVTPPAAPAAPAPVAAPTTGTPLADVNASPLAPSAPGTEAPTTPARTPEEQALYVRSLEAQVSALSARPAPAAPPAPATPAPGTAPTVDEPVYALSIPQDVLGAVFGEDATVAANGLTHLINSLAKHIHKTISAEFSTKLANLREEQTTVVQQRDQAAQIQEMQNTYYSRFPTHKNPTMLPIIQEQAALLGAQFPGAPIDDNWYNALGSRVNGVLAQLAGVIAPTSAPTPTPAPTPRPAGMLPTNAPRAQPLVPGSNDDSLNTVENIMSTLGG